MQSRSILSLCALTVLAIAFQNCAKNPNLGDYQKASTSAAASTSPSTTPAPTPVPTPAPAPVPVPVPTPAPTVQAPVLNAAVAATVTVTVGQPVNVPVSVTGTALTYQWFKNANAIANTTNTFSIAAAALTDAATYTLHSTNSAGTLITSFNLVVNPPVVVVTKPVITTAPANITVDIFGAAYIVYPSVTPYNQATFSVVATGTNLTYQWYTVNAAGVATAIAGATGASYSLLLTTAAQVTTYRVAVTNAGGTVTANATITAMSIGPIF